MSATVDALVLQEAGKLAIESRPCLDPSSDDVVVAPRVVGICGSDLHLYRDGRIGDSVVRSPLVLGHEAAGVVVEVGTAVVDLRVGERVVVEPGIACGRCRLCRIGRYNLCLNVSFLGIPPIDGLMAGLVRVPRPWVHRLPDSLTDAEGAMIEPFAVGLQAVDEAGIGPGQTVAILGAGPIGLMILQAARVRGAAAIVSIDLADTALEMAKQLGATEVVNPRQQDVGAAVRAVANADGADVVIEAVGAVPTIRQTLDLVRRGGIVTLVGISSESTGPLNVNHIVRRGIHVRSSFRYAHQHPTAISLVLQRRVDLLAPITHRFQFRDAVNGFHFVDAHKAEVIKSVIELGAD
jgi:L-iditol 2-dehydrogenase